ncbi:MAG: 16S rRNA (cytosine(967)-C(5))-methyltransferase [Acidobacteria bacterium RIFCSPLOWO2_02_FULL_61_28]|nr:MAG: 16S rRNA (cytosine(967)-C(5))-methyltransferase [Acidobacteria bacterium RIFCSPLOWO2_02_FULL_61_28]
MPTPARRAAFQILLRVETQASYASELLHSPLTAGLSAPDAALATELVLGTLRRQNTLDFIAQQLTRQKWASLDAEVRVALRLGLYQLRHLTRIPARAAVNETVELVKTAGKRSAAGMVNAVLRKGAEVELASLRPASMSDSEWLAVENSHPEWLLARWERRYGRDAALSLARANNQPSTTFIRLNSPTRSLAEIELQLHAQGVELRYGNFLKDCRAVAQGNITRTEFYRRGEIVAQDEASQMVPLLLNVLEGQSALDLCAAPGNKTAQLARWVGASGRVVCGDLHWHRLREMTPLPPLARVWKVALDGCQPLPFRNRFDRILVDAPCSGTGTLRRHPEIKWRLQPADLQDLSQKQLRLLDSAAAALETGGRMLYSTCSLEQEENRAVVERFLNQHPEFRLLPLRDDAARLEPFILPAAAAILENDFLETLPDRDGTDGFFAAIFVKTASRWKEEPNDP